MLSFCYLLYPTFWTGLFKTWIQSENLQNIHDKYYSIVCYISCRSDRSAINICIVIIMIIAVLINKCNCYFQLQYVMNFWILIQSFLFWITERMILHSRFRSLLILVSHYTRAKLLLTHPWCKATVWKHLYPLLNNAKIFFKFGPI